MLPVSKKRNLGGFPSLTSWVDQMWMDDDNFFPAFRPTSPTLRTRNFVPAANITEDDKFFLMELAVPGMTKKDFNLTVDNNVLTISAEKELSKEEEDINFTRHEYDYRNFTRTFWLPENVKETDIKAKYENGILKVQIPKMKAETPPKKTINIS